MWNKGSRPPSALSTFNFQWAPLASGVENTFPFPKESLHSSTTETDHRYRILTALCLRWWKQNCRVPSFVGANTTGKAHSVSGGSNTFIESMLHISFFSISLAFSPASCGKEYVDLTSGRSGSILWVAVVIWPRRPSHIDLNGSNMRINFLWHASWSSRRMIECSQLPNTLWLTLLCGSLFSLSF